MAQPPTQPVLLQPFSDLEEVRQVLQQQLTQVQRQIGAAPVTAFSGSRLSNVGNPLYPADAVTLGYLRSVILPTLQVSINARGSSTGGGVGVSTLTTSQDALAALSAGWGNAQTNQSVWVSDFAHMLAWSGSGWVRGAGDLDHSDTFVDFGAAPSDTGWHACDGGTVTYLQYNGTLGTRVLPDTFGTSAYGKASNGYSPGITTAGAPTVNLSVSVSGLTGVNVGSTNVIQGTTTSTIPVAADGHLHSVTLTGSGTGTTTLVGDPIPNYSVLRYYRR